MNDYAEELRKKLEAMSPKEREELRKKIEHMCHQDTPEYQFATLLSKYKETCKLIDNAEMLYYCFGGDITITEILNSLGKDKETFYNLLKKGESKKQ